MLCFKKQQSRKLDIRTRVLLLLLDFSIDQVQFFVEFERWLFLLFVLSKRLERILHISSQRAGFNFFNGTYLLYRRDVFKCRLAQTHFDIALRKNDTAFSLTLFILETASCPVDIYFVSIFKLFSGSDTRFYLEFSDHLTIPHARVRKIAFLAPFHLI